MSVIKIEENSIQNSGRLVVIGSSAGGIEALLKLVSTLPEDFPAPIVLAQHLDPRESSVLGELLQNRTKLPVQILESSSPLQPGRIYVTPANRHVFIEDGWVKLREDGLGRPKPSIDLLLSTGAQAYGPRLIAVILTGMLKDGAAGTVQVKKAGGLIIIQNPQTARFPAMPIAVPETVVDYKVDLEAIGPLLYQLLKPIYLEGTV